MFTHRRGVIGTGLRLLLAASLALGWMAGPWGAETAYACSCNSYVQAVRYVKSVDVIVIGTVDFLPGHDASARWGGFPEPEPWAVAVDTYVKGSGALSLPVYDYVFCEYPAKEGGRYLLFLKEHDGDYRTGLCMGNAAANTLGGQLWIQEVRVATWLNLLPGGTTFHRVALQAAAAGIVGLAGIAVWGCERLTSSRR